MRNGLIVLTLLSLCSEMLPRPVGHRTGSVRTGSVRTGSVRHGSYGHARHHVGYRSRPVGFGVGIGLGGVGLGIGYNDWYYGGWRNWNRGWWDTSPYWYVGADWSSLSLERRLNAIEKQIAVLEAEEEAGNPDAAAQLDYLRRRRDQLARQL